MPLLRTPVRPALVLAACLAWLNTAEIIPAQAQQLPAAQESHAQRVARINGGRVAIVSGGIGGTYIRIATDLGSVLDDGDNLRILPIAGKGSVQNILDILYLKGIDIGIVQSDVLSYLKQQPAFRNIDRRIHYIAKLYNEEFHLIAGRGITSLDELGGHKVNFGVKGSGTFMTATTVFKALGIDITPVHYDQALALEKIKAGEIAATVYVAGKPARAIAALSAGDGLKLIGIPYTAELQATYLPASFTHQDYPGLIGGSNAVETIAVGAVMAVFNWTPGSVRYRRVAKFVDAFFAKFAEFRKPPRHRKWQEVSLTATLPGWTRFAPAQAWLDAHARSAQASQPAGTGAPSGSFQRFVSTFAQQPGAAPMTPAQQRALFTQFKQWQESRR